MQHSDAKLRLNDAHLRLLRIQHGVIARYQLLRLGASDADIRSLLRRGELILVQRSIYRHRLVDSSDEQLLMVGVLLARGRAAVTGVAALRLWNVELPRFVGTASITLLVPRDVRMSINQVLVVHTRRFPTTEVRRRAQLPVVSVGYCILQLARDFGAAWAGASIDAAFRDRVMSLAEFRSTVEFMTENRVRGARVGRALLDDRTLGQGGSVLEQRVLSWLVAAGVEPPSLQHRIVVAGHTYFVDMAYPELRLGIEVDGFQWHADRTRFDKDHVRQYELASVGWELLRFTATTSRDDLIRVVRAALRARRSPL